MSWWEQKTGVPYWAITKHADIVAIGKQPETFLNGPRLVITPDPDNPERQFPPTLIQLDPPKHGIYRQLVSKRFTPRYLKRMNDDIEQIGKEIVDALVTESDEGECDFVERVSAPLPIAVIAWMLGVPREDWKLLFDWTNRTIGAADPEYQTEGATPQETAHQAMVELFTYFTKLVEEKKKNPADDLVTIFANAQIDGEPLPFMDVLAWCFIIVIAGNETTRNGTSGGMLAFIEHQQSCASCRPIRRCSCRRSKRSCAGRARSSTSGAPPPRTSRSAARRSRRATRSRCSIPPRIATRRSSRIRSRSGSTASQPAPGLRRRRALLPGLARGAARDAGGLQAPAAAHRGDRAGGPGVAAPLRPRRRREAPADPLQAQARVTCWAKAEGRAHRSLRVTGSCLAPSGFANSQ